MKRTLLTYLVITSIFASASDAEFQVNTRTSRNQANAAIAADENGNFVVVWSSWFVSKSNEIRGRRFVADGSPIDANEFEINTTQPGNQKEPSVAMDAEGNFVVVWQGPGEDQNDIFARWFDSNGQASAAEFRVNSNTVDEQLSPSVAMNDSGSFVVVWEREEVYGQLHVRGVSCQIYDSNGSTVGSEIEADPLVYCRHPDVGIDADGNFVLVWDKEKETSAGYDYHRILARQYNAQGVCITERFDVSTVEFHSITHPSIGMNEDGYFVVVWSGHPSSTSEVDINARLYNPSCGPFADQFIVNTTTPGKQANPAVEINNQRDFVILWNSETEPGISIRDIFGQRYSSICVPVGDEFCLNTYLVDDQKYPDVAMKENGEFIAVWQSHGQDGSDYGIFADSGPAIPCADFTGNGFVNFHDYCILAEEWLKVENPLEADLINDNRIDEQDLGALCRQWLKPCYECSQVDIDNSGKIDFKDYSCWAGGYLLQGPLDADITGNGIIDMADLKAMLFHWPNTCE